MRKSRVFALVVLVAVLAAGAGAASMYAVIGTASPQTVGMVDTCSSPSPAVSSSYVPTANDLREEATGYMYSHCRVLHYRQAWVAAEKVARALYDGKLGSVEKYNFNKTALVPGYTGWGGMQTPNQSFYAWVWWNADGTIDYSKGVTGFAFSGIIVKAADKDSPYTATIPRDGYSDQVTAESIGADGSVKYGLFHRPTTLAELRALDREVLTRLKDYNSN